MMVIVLFNIIKISQQKEGFSFFGTILGLIMTFLVYHFWLAGRKIVAQRVEFEESVPEKKRKSVRRKK